MIRVFEPNIGQSEIDAVQKTLVARRVGPGDRVVEFESLLCKETGAKHAVCCNSGTTALMLAIRAMTLGDGVVTFPSYTFLAGANAANLCQKTVRTYPIGDDLCCVKPWPIANEKQALRIYVSHNAHVKGWKAFAEAGRNEAMPCLHDASQSIGVLKFSKLETETATLSFSVPKLITCGQGGAVLTNNEAVADVCRRVCDHGGGRWRRTRIHEQVGGNFRMADLNAALGITQLQRLPELLGIRRERFAWYREHFPEMADGWCALVCVERPEPCISALADEGYEALQPYRPVRESKPFQANPVDKVAVKAADELLYLPVHWMLKREDVDNICRILKDTDPCPRGN